MKLVGESRIVVVGRQAPPPSAVQACAEALTGAACTRLAARQWYQRIDAVHELTDGRLVATVIPTASRDAFKATAADGREDGAAHRHRDHHPLSRIRHCSCTLRSDGAGALYLRE
jgi:hypothetical protein